MKITLDVPADFVSAASEDALRTVVADFNDWVEMADKRLAALEGAAFPAKDRWIDVANGALYLGLSANALRKAAKRGEIPFEQNGVAGKMWFRVSALDAYRRGERQR